MLRTKKLFKQAIIHIGTEKTGSTSLQQFCYINRENLINKGIFYPQSPGTHSQTKWLLISNDNIHKHPLLAAYHKVFSPDDVIKRRKQYEHEINKELNNHKEDTDTLLISCENLHSVTNQKKYIANLKQFLDKYVESYRVVVYFRRQDKLATSLYSTAILSGSRSTPPFKKLSNMEPTYYYHFLAIYNNWAGVFGYDSVKVRIFEREKLFKQNIINDFFNQLDINTDEFKPVEDLNQSFSTDALLLLYSINLNLPLQKDGKINDLRRSLGKYLLDKYPGNAILCDKQTAEALYHVYTKSNDNLFSMLKQQHGQNIAFDLDFSMYPEKVEYDMEKFDKLTPFFIELWKHHCESHQTQKTAPPEKTNKLNKILKSLLPGPN